MKKRNTQSLKLRKSSISKLGNEQIKGGIKLTDTCTSFIDACPTAWCPQSLIPRDCVFTTW
ncbi:hypothetical protein [uncultured Kordia sp.]|uniref:hypothetical protein n=1 Tax=uncultured Kordia sp. TaxID=507699 RepID=UPI00260D454F|nr:hypothetical protein [uncultured Kordia sp.]